MTFGSLWFSAPAIFAADEICASCGQDVRVNGEFSHRKDDASVTIEGATADNAAAFREEINGKNFTVTIAHLPAGRYTISIGEVETLAGAAGERVFDVTAGDVALAKNFDILATAGGARKVTTITGAVQHEDDTIKGPVTLVFAASQGNAKFNTLDVKNSSGASVVSFNASELADAFSGEAARIPVISEPPIWRDPSHPLKERINDLIRRMSQAEKVAQLQNGAPGISTNNLPGYPTGLPAYNYWNEALHGVANSGRATVFPEPVGMASTFDPELLHKEGHVVGVEGRAKYNDYVSKHNGDAAWWKGLTFWTPNINIFRDPRWGRGQETYGEDPFLTGMLSVPFIQGLQGDDPNYMLAMGCAKHYAVHSGPEADRHRFDAEPSERDLYETYLPQFERAVRVGHVGGVMGAYSSLYGIPDCASTFLLTDLLRTKWGFDGYICSDCGAIGDISGRGEHHYVNTPEEAAALGVKAGCDLCCGGEYNALARAVQKNLITEKEIDNALYHTLWTRFRLGLFDPPEKVPYSNITIKDNDTPENRELALQIARESLVLLKNNGILPLNPGKIKHIAVIGPTADSVGALQGNYNGSASHPITVLRGIRQVLSNLNIEVTYTQGSPITTEAGRGFGFGRRGGATAPAPLPAEQQAQAISNALTADVVIYVGGITPDQENEEHDRTSIELPQVQEDLVRALYKTGKPMVMVNCSGSAVALPWEATNLPAILQAWYPGESGGQAVAEVLFGKVNPSGHLPLTFYRATADLPAFTNYSMANRTYRYFNGTPLYAFGHGLSYTKFDFKSGKLESNEIAADGTAKVTLTVKNSGKRDGDEVAQVYFRHVNSAVPQPKLALCGFARVHLNRGESGKVTIEIPAERLRYWDTDKKQYVVEPGKYEFLIGAASDDIRLKLPMTITAPTASGFPGLPPAATKHWTADNGNGTYSNPLFYGEFEDPDPIRVGDDYYLAGTTMHMMPSVEILHSKDLVNWELVGYCTNKLDLGPAYRLEGGNIYGNGIWAPCLRYHNGTFYILCNVNGGGLQIFRSKSINGPWEHNQLPNRHDMSVLFDDDLNKVFIISGGGSPYPIEELSPDLRSFDTNAPKHQMVISPGGPRMGEGHHLYKIKGKYYDVSATPGGTVNQMIAKADSIDGPWEVTAMVDGESLGVTTAAPERAQANDRGLWLHQGGMCDTPSGDWWCIIMSDHGGAGRIISLVPITWDNGFPLIGLPGNLRKAPNTWIKPDTGFTQETKPAFVHGSFWLTHILSHQVPNPKPTYVPDDNFNSGKLNPHWQWNHVPDDTKWSLTERPGVLRLHSLPANDFFSARNSLCQRPPGPESIMTVEMDTTGLVAGDTAGLALLSNPYAWIGVVKTAEGTTLESFQGVGRGGFNGGARTAPPSTPVYGPTNPPSHLWLRVHCNFDSEQAVFSWSLDGKKFTLLGNPFATAFQLTTFQGVRPALFNFNTSGQPGGYADFDNYTVDEPRARGIEREIPLGKTILLTSGADGSYLAADTQNNTLVNAAVIQGENARFQVIDLGKGRVALKASNGKYVSVAQEAAVLKDLAGKNPGEAESFQWINLMRGDTMLMSLTNHRYLATKPNEPGPVTATATGPSPVRKKGECFKWKAVE